MYQLFEGAVTNYDKLSGSNCRDLFSHSSGAMKSEIKGFIKTVLPSGILGENTSSSLWPVAAGITELWPHHCHLCLILIHLIPYVSLPNLFLPLLYKETFFGSLRGQGLYASVLL